MSWKTAKLNSLLVASAMTMSVVSLPVVAEEPEQPVEEPTTEDVVETTPEVEPVEAEFTLGAHVFDYGESINTVNIKTGAVKEDTVTEGTFTVVSSGYCAAVDKQAYENVERTVTGVTVTEEGVTLDLECKFGGAGEGTLTYASGVNHSNTVTYVIQQNEEFTLADGTVVKPGEMTFTQKGQWTDPEVDAFISGTTNQVQYRLYIPENANDGNKHPLIVWLHGAGETGAATNPNNSSQIRANRGALGFTLPENQELFGGAFVLAPQAPANGRWNEANLQCVVDTITMLTGKYNIDKEQISVSGCSMGGGGTVRIATTWPDIWNAVVPICPAVGPEATDAVIKSTMAKQNVFLIHSANDPTVKVASSRRLDSLLKYNEYAEYETVNYGGVEYPGHWSWIYMAQNDPTAADGTPFMTWLANQRKVGEIEEGKAGATVLADPESPSGYTVTFVYDATESEKEVVGVSVGGAFNYTNKFYEDGGETKNVDPYGFEDGMYASNCHGDGSGAWGYSAELTDKDADGIWAVSFPITSGSYGYNYTITYADGTTAKIEDPANPANAEGKMNPEGNKNSGDTTSSIVKGHWDAEKQSKSPNMDYVLPVEDPAQAGTVTYVEYTNAAGKKSHVGVYTPAGYDAEREEPYKTIYISHGAGGDETDWYHMGSIDDIMDNMVASGEAEAAVIVTMDNSALGWDYTKTLPNIVDIIIPMIEENYNVSTAVEDRAMCGLSAGAMTTTNMFKQYPAEFGYFGMFSGSDIPDSGLEWNPDYAKPIVMVTTGSTDFASSRWSGSEGSFSSERLDAWAKENIPDTYVTEDIYVKGSHDWFEWPQSFAMFIKDVAWKDANGNEKPAAKAEATAVEGNTIKFVYDDEDDKNAVKVTVAGNFQWHDPAEADQYVAMGDNSAMKQVRAEDYEDGLYNSSGLNGQEIYELVQTSGEHFELEMTVPGNLYFYDYTVTYADGSTKTIKDPTNLPKANPATGKDSGHSLIYVGSADNCTPGQEWIYETEGVEKGSRAYVPYEAIDGTTKYLEVYLPAGYDETKTYPTLYVSHGGGGNEAEWMEIGAAANIMDNLIAAGEVEPTVMVTMDNQIFGWNDEVTIPNLVEKIIPFMEKNYAVSKDAKDRALCGLSMGSMFTNSVAKTCPEEFGYLGSFSGGNNDIDGTHYDAEKLNDTVLYLTAGCIDMAYNNKMGIASLDFIAMYDEIGVKYDFDVLLGAHDWGVWRESLTNFAKDYLWTAEEATTPEKPETKPENKPANPSKPGVNTGDAFNGGILGGMMAAAAGLAAAAWFALKRKH